MNQLTPAQRYTVWSASQRKRWAGGGGEEEIAEMFPHLAGRYYPGGSSGSTSAPTANQLHGYPMCVPVTGRYDRVAIAKVGTSAPANYRVGVYGPVVGDSVDGLPLVWESAVLAAGEGAEDIDETIDVLLPAGWYLLAVVTDSTQSVRVHGFPPLDMLVGASNGGTGAALNAVAVAHTFGPLPSPGPTWSSFSPTGNPKVLLRRAAA